MGLPNSMIYTDISIHTLRVEGDVPANQNILPFSISIHTLRVEGDVTEIEKSANGRVFQSTPSAWRVTPVYILILEQSFNFNPHPPRGG